MLVENWLLFLCLDDYVIFYKIQQKKLALIRSTQFFSCEKQIGHLLKNLPKF